ncbi:PLAC8 family protein [Actinidia rufa]|uniref:PLAC8 family protein n=1 Tax=Actinidia rufa TaxID=165716 RepID=A0A7J0G7P4_9ERIC|nr:PLAC8 family protein [Actinidia rufa]
MASQAHLDKMKVRQDYRNLWHTDLMSTMGNDPGCTHAAVAICLAVVDVEKTQHKIEMDKRDGKFGPQPAMMVPPFQHMSRLDQQVPPSVGYGQQPYGYPPPPQNQGYPPPGYPR